MTNQSLQRVSGPQGRPVDATVSPCPAITLVREDETLARFGSTYESKGDAGPEVLRPTKRVWRRFLANRSGSLAC